MIGYYTLTPGSVTKGDVPQRVGKGLSNHPVPVIILARLAVGKTEHGTGIGKGLLRDALLRIVHAADISDHSLALPVGPHITHEDVQYIADKLKEVFKEVAR